MGIRLLIAIIYVVAITGCASTSSHSPSEKTGIKNAKARLGYVQSKSKDVNFKTFDYQYSMDMKTSIEVVKEDRQNFDLCKLHAGQLVPLENMVETCSDAIATVGVSPKTKMASYYNRGLIYQKLEKMVEARRDFQSAIDLDPNFGDAYLAMAGLHMLDNNPKLARETIQAALSTNIRHPAYAHYLLGHALETDNKFIEARAEYRRALELRPNWRDAQRRINRINISWPE